MGSSHARAYHAAPEFEITGLVSRGEASRRKLNAELGGKYPEFNDFARALTATADVLTNRLGGTKPAFDL